MPDGSVPPGFFVPFSSSSYILQRILSCIARSFEAETHVFFKKISIFRYRYMDEHSNL